MPRLHLVRHGHAAAGWADHVDPGLDAVGAAQAEAVAARLAGELAVRPIVSSPLLRTQQTAAPLARRWSSTIELAGPFGEIPSPSSDPAERAAWLESVMVSRWSDLGPLVGSWRDRLVAATQAVPVDTIVFTHFVAINALVAAAEGRPETVVFLPANASVTLLDVDAGSGALTVVRRGEEATPEVG